MKITQIDLKSKTLPIFDEQIGLAEITQITEDESEDRGILKKEDGTPCRNYIFIRVTKEDEVIPILDLADIPRLFDMSPEDSELLTDYMKGGLGGSIPVTVHTWTEAGNDTIHYFINNTVDIEAYEHGNVNAYVSGPDMNQNVAANISSLSYVQTFMLKIMEAGQRRYNQVNYTDKVQDICKIVRDIRIMNDNGKRQSLSISGLDNLISMVKDALVVGEN